VARCVAVVGVMVSCSFEVDFPVLGVHIFLVQSGSHPQLIEKLIDSCVCAAANMVNAANAVILARLSQT
jgi:hypothetical protein